MPFLVVGFGPPENNLFFLLTEVTSDAVKYPDNFRLKITTSHFRCQMSLDNFSEGQRTLHDYYPLRISTIYANILITLSNILHFTTTPHQLLSNQAVHSSAFSVSSFFLLFISQFRLFSVLTNVGLFFCFSPMYYFSVVIFSSFVCWMPCDTKVKMSATVHTLVPNIFPSAN